MSTAVLLLTCAVSWLLLWVILSTWDALPTPLGLFILPPAQASLSQRCVWTEHSPSQHELSALTVDFYNPDVLPSLTTGHYNNNIYSKMHLLAHKVP